MKSYLKERKHIAITSIEGNTGQLEQMGVKSNPRKWSDEEVESLKQSLTDSRWMMEIKPLIVYPYGDKYVVIGGNMRLHCAQQLGIEELDCVVLKDETPSDCLNELIIKDNTTHGEWDWDALQRDWNDLPLGDWGLGDLSDEGTEERSVKETERLSSLEYHTMYYEPVEQPNVDLRKCVDMSKYEKKIAVIENSTLSQEQKETMKLFAYRFMKIDFEMVANYYAFKATEEEREVMERLRLVLIDNGGGLR